MASTAPNRDHMPNVIILLIAKLVHKLSIVFLLNSMHPQCDRRVYDAQLALRVLATPQPLSQKERSGQHRGAANNAERPNKPDA
jgi:hypothetical protein